MLDDHLMIGARSLVPEPARQKRGPKNLSRAQERDPGRHERGMADFTRGSSEPKPQ